MSSDSSLSDNYHSYSDENDNVVGYRTFDIGAGRFETEEIKNQFRDITQQKSVKNLTYIDIEQADEFKSFLEDKDFERECDRGIGTVTDDELLDEADYIISEYLGPDVEKDILIQILILFHKKDLTPQYITNFYSSQYYDSRITDDDIYLIQDAIKNYKNISKRKQDIRKKLTPFIAQEEELLFNNLFSKFDTNVIEDLEKYYNVISNTNNKDPKSYAFQREYYGQFTRNFLFTPLQYTCKLIDPSNDNFPEEPTANPTRDFASFFDDLNKRFKDDFNKQLKDNDQRENIIINFASDELKRYPPLIDYVRREFVKDALVFTTPTDLGMTDPDCIPSGKYGSVKRLNGTPISTFKNNSYWILIVQAHQEGLIEYDIDFKDKKKEKIGNLVKQYLVANDGEWDEMVRIKVAERSIEYIWDNIKKEIERDLLKSARDFVCGEIYEQCYQKLIFTPFVDFKKDRYFSVPRPIVVCHVQYNSENDNYYFVYVAETGKIEDFEVIVSNFRLLSKIDIFRDRVEMMQTESMKRAFEAKRKIYDFLKNKIGKNVGTLIAVTATCSKSVEMFNIVKDLVVKIQNISKEQARMVFIPSELADLYSKSKVCEQEQKMILQDFQKKSTLKIKDNDEIVKNLIVAASAARRVQNPLPEILRLISSDLCDIVSFSFHELQSFFREEEDKQYVKAAIERAGLRTVSLLGCDISSLDNYHLSNVLQFVPGLGPIGAKFIFKCISNEYSHEFRKIPDVIKKYFPEKVFKNSAPFLRIPVDFKHSTEITNINTFLDGLIIPEEYYTTVTKYIEKGIEVDPAIEYFRKDILENIETNISKDRKSRRRGYDDLVDSYIAQDRNVPRQMIEKIAEELTYGPYERIRSILPEFEIDYEAGHSQHSGSSLILGKSKISRFQDDRRSLKNMKKFFMTDPELFNAITSMSTDHLTEKTFVDVKIKERCKNSGKGSSSCYFRCEHSSGIEFYVEGPSPSELAAKLEIQYTKEADLFDIEIRCAIDKIDYSRLIVFATLNENVIEDFCKNYKGYRKNAIPGFDIEKEESAQRERAHLEEEKNRRKKYDKRNIQHDFFKNISLEEATDELIRRGVGSFIFRPSSKGSNYLSLTILFPSNVVHNIKIEESDKPTQKGIGERLKIGKLEFDDLEDIRWNFVDPLVTNINKLKDIKVNDSRKWIEDPEEAERILTEEFQNKRGTLVYRLTSNRVHPGHLILKWVKRDKEIIDEDIKLFGRDITFKGRTFEDFFDLITHFKQGFRK